MNEIYVKKPQKNNFDLSHEVKMTGNMGDLMPCYIQDVIPGDSFKVDTQQLVRFSPLLAPIMHNVDFKLDYFFVPYRLVWSEWKDFITGGEDGNDLPSYPRFAIDTTNRNSYLTKGSLSDYLGVPPYIAGDASDKGSAWTNIAGATTYIDILKYRAYQLIYHEYFRDQNVGTEYTQYTTSGIQASGTLAEQLTLRKSNWQKDYFTSALPFLQRGTEVALPLGTVAPIVYADPGVSGGDSQFMKRPVSQGGGALINVNNLTSDSSGEVKNDTGFTSVNIDISQSHQVDLATATGATINALRKASALQQWLELMARAGSRYREQIYAIFGEKIPDYTVQIPKYLGGGKTPIMISEILSTYHNNASSGATEDRPVGDMSGHALALGSDIGFTEAFDEHGVILGLCRVIPKSSYIQGLNKFWTKFDKFDHYFPQFANLGEQEVKNSEIFVSGNSGATVDNKVFGYQQRYAEYKYAENKVAGDFRDTLQYWHMARTFDSAPLLNQSFIECSTDDRIFAITDANEDKLWMSLYHKVSAVRPIPYFSNPSLT